MVSNQLFEVGVMKGVEDFRSWPNWRPVSDAPSALVLLHMVLIDTGESLGFDIGYLEDGEWMLNSEDGDISYTKAPTHYMYLPDMPEKDGRAS